MTLAPIPGSFRPGAATTPQLVDVGKAAQTAALQFLTAEERATATLMGFFEQARLDLETFIRTGDLSVSDATFYRQLLDETDRIGSKLNSKGAQWVSDTIPEAYSSGWRTWSSTVVPQAALEALSRDSLGLIRQTTAGIRDSIRGSIAQGILEGLSGEAVRARILASGLTNIPHWPTVEYRAGVIARTETMKAYNAGTLSGIEESGARFVRWLASPDEATCPICLPRDHHVYRIGSGDLPNDPYPSALPLPKIPAHPRCRCTVRAEYRGPDGQVIRATAPEIEPKLPTDAMGGQDEPTVPPAAGDFLASLKTLDNVDDAARQFWRNVDLGGLGSGFPGANGRTALQILANDLSHERYTALMRLRYGIDLEFSGAKWADFAPRFRLGILSALETYAEAGYKWRDPSALVSFEIRHSLVSLPNPGVYYPKGHVRADPGPKIVLALSKYPPESGPYAANYRIGDRDYFESSVIHELGHALDWQLQQDTAARTQFRGIHLATKNDASDDMNRVRAQIENTKRDLEASRKRIAEIESDIAEDPEGVPGWVMRQLETHRELVPRYERMLDALLAAEKGLPDPGKVGVFLSDYAKTNEFEDFADTLVAFMLDRESLRLKSPARYEHVLRLLGLDGS